MKNILKIVSGISIFVFVLSPFSVFTNRATAATITTFSDSLSRLKASQAANHEILFVTPTGVASTQTITVTFDADFTGLGSIIEDDVDLAEGDTGTCSTASYTEEATVAAGATAAQWDVTIAGQVITFTSGGASAIIAATKCVRIQIGTNATDSGTGVNQISNGAAANEHTVVIGGTFTDSGTAVVDIIAEDQVTITATVSPTFSFTIDDTAIGFGTLSSTTGRWATADATGGDASATTPTAANVLGVTTNAASGWTLTYSGATLTSGGNTITDAAPIDEDSDGTQGSEQFGISASTNGDSTIASGYLRDAAADFNYVVSTTTVLASESAPTATESISVSYLANISGATEPGSYTTTITYVATGNF